MVTERLGLKATGLLLAALLWIAVAARRPTEGSVRVRVVPTLDGTQQLLGEPLEIRAVVAGRAADLVKLYSAPLVARPSISADAPDSLMLDVAPGDVRVPTELANSIRVLELRPSRVTVRLRRITR
jgi:hypothetical protein